jgi:branched-chain amino acid transport system substrate-binding protein
MKKEMGVGLLVALVITGMFFLSLVTRAEAAQPIKMGVISSWDEFPGQGIKEGAQLAIKEINAAGGLLGRQIEGIYYDAKMDVEEAKKVAERALYRDKVDVACGFWRSALITAVQPVIMEAKKIYLDACGSYPPVVVKRIMEDYETYKYTFAVVGHHGYQYPQYKVPIIKAAKLGLKKVAVIMEKAPYFDPIYERLVKEVKDVLVYSARTSVGATNFSVEFTQAKAAGANVLYWITTGKGGVAGVKQWYDMQLPMLLLGYTNATLDPKFMEVTEGKGEGVQGLNYIGNAGFAITPRSRPYREAYKQMFGGYPMIHTIGTTYDIIGAWAEGVKLAGTVHSDEVVKAMESPKFRYEGALGLVEGFDKVHCAFGGAWKEGDNWGSGIIQWQNGKMEVIWPDMYKTSDMFIPERVKKLMGR